jgi:hypothetical protein
VIYGAFTQHCHIIETGNESHRFKQSSKTKNKGEISQPETNPLIEQKKVNSGWVSLQCKTRVRFQLDNVIKAHNERIV